MTDPPAAMEWLVRKVDALEAETPGRLTLGDLLRELPDLEGVLEDALRGEVLLVDRRDLLTPAGEWAPVTLVRLNRHHPLVRRLTSDAVG